jgi:UDP-N-acetylmuramyl pentapeptide synthase
VWELTGSLFGILGSSLVSLLMSLTIEVLLKNLNYLSSKNLILSEEIQEIVFDSRQVKRGAAFFCLNGEKTDGHHYS